MEELPDYSAAEIQGMLTGLTCAGITEAQYESWRPILTGDQDTSGHSDRLRDALSALMALIEKSLKGQDFRSGRYYLPILIQSVIVPRLWATGAMGLALVCAGVEAWTTTG